MTSAAARACAGKCALAGELREPGNPSGDSPGACEGVNRMVNQREAAGLPELRYKTIRHLQHWLLRAWPLQGLLFSLAAPPGLDVAVAGPWRWSERATPPAGSPERGFRLWQWVLRAGATRGAAAWLRLRCPPPTNRPRANSAAAGWAVPLFGRAELCSGLRSCPTADSAHLSVPHLLLASFPPAPPFKK